MKTLEDLRRARTRSDLFSGDEADAKRTFRHLAALAHPDAAGGTAELFIKLNELYAGGTPTSGRRATRIHSRRLDYALADAPPDLRDPLVTRYDAVLASDVRPEPRHLHIARSPRDTDLIRNAYTNLTAVRSAVPEPVRPFLPHATETFRFRPSAGRPDHQVLAVSPPDASQDWFSLGALPHAIDGRDAAWMLRRILYVLHYVHVAGYAHCGIDAGAIALHGPLHGVMLDRWWYSAELSAKPPARPKGASAVTEATTNTDLAGVGAAFANRVTTKQIRAFCNGLAFSHDTAQAATDFDDLLARLYGRRRFRPFTPPPEVFDVRA